MHPYAVDELVQERRAELQRQRHAARGGLGDGVPGWRRRAGGALASLAVAVAVPRSDRETTRGRVGAALSVDPCL